MKQSIGPDMEIKADVYVPVSGIWKVIQYIKKKIKRKEKKDVTRDPD